MRAFQDSITNPSCSTRVASTIIPFIMIQVFPGAAWFHHQLIPSEITSPTASLQPRTLMAVWQLGNCTWRRFDALPHCPHKPYLTSLCRLFSARTYLFFCIPCRPRRAPQQPSCTGTYPGCCLPRAWNRRRKLHPPSIGIHCAS